MSGWFHDKKVLITGGSSGIGLEAAKALARQGAHVAIAARNQAKLDEAVAALRALAPGQTFAGVAMDVTDRVRVRAAVDEVLTALGGLDVLVCNSGFARCAFAVDLSDDDFDKLMDANYFGHTNVVRAFLPHFIAQKRGDICLVSSMLGFLGAAGFSAYCGSKWAITGFAECLRQEMTDHGVRVTVFYPPTTRTPGLDKENETKPDVVWTLEANNSFLRTYDPDAVASSLLGAIARGRFENVVGSDSALVFHLQRKLPGLARSLADGEYKAAKQKVAEGKGAPKR